MQHITFDITNKKAYKDALKKAKNKKYKTKLIQIFTSLDTKKDIQKLLRKLNKDFTDTLIIGTTTAGEISSAKMYEDTTIISLSLFEKTQLSAHYVKNINTKEGIKLSKKISSKHSKAAIILSEGLQGEDYEGFIKGIKKQNPQLIISGGLAGDNFKLKKTFIIYRDKVLSCGAVGVSFSGKKLFADNSYNLNWIPIGKSFTITSAQGNVVHTINNQNAAELFSKYLGKQILQNNAASLPDFQLLYKEGSTIVSRTPMAVDGTSLVFAGPLKEGEVVQFGFSNASSVISGANRISQHLNNNPAEAIYIYSCIARKTLLGKTLEKEFSSFETIAPTAGFFTYGEFYSTNANNALLNCTTTILILSERKKRQKKKTLQKLNAQDLDSVTFDALTHFIRQTSDELRENIDLLNQYKTAVDMTSLISKTDLNGKITYVNDNFCRVSQYSKEELLGRSHNIVRDENVSNFIFKKMWHNITRGKAWRGLLSNKAKDGSIYYVDATIMPIFDEHNEIKEYIAIRQDITKQIQSKKRIQEKEKLIKAIFDNQDSIVIYASKTKGMMSVNKKLFDYLDYSSIEEFKEKHKCICDLFLEEEGYTYPAKHPNWIDDIATNNTQYNKAKMFVKDGTIHTFNIIIKKIDDEYIINMYDITSLEEALNKAYSSEQAKSTFLANMSHEIRTPLNGILGFTDILSKKDLDSDSKRYIDIIQKSGQTLLNVVNDILDFSKLESGELTLYESDANLFEEMEAAVSTFASISKNKHIDYYTYIDTNIPQTLKCDIQRIKQVMNNLISNAIKFTPQEGEVGITISLKNVQNNLAQIKFSVKDSGIGIAPDKIKTIFSAFSQADNSISREFGGTGLGLAISSQYISMMGSQLQVKSELGKGSEFFFTLTLPITNDSKAFRKNSFQENLTIKILTGEDEISCGINEIIKTYLDAWKCEYSQITTLDNLDEDTDIVIVCAKLFNHDRCQQALDQFSKLQFIYVEGSKINTECNSEKFHLIEQPMTGSALFDKIITLTTPKNLTNKSSSQDDTPTFKGNILVAEDNETNQALISIMLESRGLSFKIVANGQEAVDEVLQNKQKYDIIFMDINMPVLDGVSATKILRQNNYNKPIISLSANVIESDIASFKEAGVDDSLHKPIVPHELDSILTTYLNKKAPSQRAIAQDIVNLQQVADQLKIPDLNVIKHLLKSFTTTAKKIITTLQKETLTKAVAHNIAGVSGNLRFQNLYEFSRIIEKEIEGWSEEEINDASQALQSHLEDLVAQIEKLEG